MHLSKCVIKTNKNQFFVKREILRISTFVYDRVVCKRPTFPWEIFLAVIKMNKQLFEHIRGQIAWTSRV